MVIAMESGDDVAIELQVLESYIEDSRWLMENYDDIKKDYAEKYVAVKDNQVIETDENANRLLDKLRATNADICSVLVEFIPPEDLTVVP